MTNVLKELGTTKKLEGCVEDICDDRSELWLQHLMALACDMANQTLAVRRQQRHHDLVATTKRRAAFGMADAFDNALMTDRVS